MTQGSEHAVLRDQVYQGIRRAIISGEFRPGAIIKEGDLATQYGVSKTPVREALCMLAFQGLVSPLPRAGYLVASISVRDVQEACHLRQLLEVEAVGLAVGRITPQEIAALEKVMDSPSAADAPVYNREFHLIIARASGSRRLAALVEQLLDEMDRMLALDPHIAAPTGPYEHADIVTALQARDVQGAQEAMRRHVEGGKLRILEHF